MKQRTFLEALIRLCRRFTGAVRPQPFSWSTASLKDLGLSRSDLPAIECGHYAADETRRLR